PGSEFWILLTFIGQPCLVRVPAATQSSCPASQAGLASLPELSTTLRSLEKANENENIPRTLDPFGCPDLRADVRRASDERHRNETDGQGLGRTGYESGAAAEVACGNNRQ